MLIILNEAGEEIIVSTKNPIQIRSQNGKDTNFIATLPECIINAMLDEASTDLKKENKDLRCNLDLVSAENEMLKKAHRKQCKKGKTQKTDRLSAGCK